MNPLTARPAEGLDGTIRVPGDKSISHRALLLGASAVGETVVRGLLEGADVRRTAAALRALGAGIEREENGVWRICGRGVGGLAEPSEVLDLGNSGTGVRLLMGLLATHPFATFLTGDASLVARPMDRVTAPLREMGADVVARSGGRLPLALLGTAEPVPILYRLPVPSAQVKSAVLLAGLNAPGRTGVVEPVATRDHTERMLGHFGARLRRETDEDGTPVVWIEGQPELAGREVAVPADISSAAFPLVAAAALPGARATVTGVGVNPLRTGLLDCLREMGAEIVLENERDAAGEPVADIAVRGCRLHGIEVPPERAPRMIDEYPILAVAAATAEGTTVMRGLGELRVKESDRLRAVARGLERAGVEVEEGRDSLTVRGCGGRPAGGALIETALDHRIAMSFLVLGLLAEAPVAIDDATMIETSFPGFAGTLRRLGADILEGDAR